MAISAGNTCHMSDNRSEQMALGALLAHTAEVVAKLDETNSNDYEQSITVIKWDLTQRKGVTNARRRRIK